MRIVITTLILLLTTTYYLLGQGRTYHNGECEKTNITLKTIDSSNPLHPYLVDEDREGVLKVHPFSMEEIGGWKAFQDALTNNLDNTYEFVGITKGRLLKGYYYRYQQHYQGIPVVYSIAIFAIQMLLSIS